MTYQCVPTSSPEYLLRICEGHSHAIHCYGEKKVHIIEANYGRLTGGQICPGPIKTTYCGAAGSQAKVRSICEGKPNCVLHATNSIYGDPCHGTKKYLEVRIIQLNISFRLYISSSYISSYFIGFILLHSFLILVVRVCRPQRRSQVEGLSSSRP